MALDRKEGKRLADEANKTNSSIDITNARTFAQANRVLDQLLSENQFSKDRPQQEGRFLPSLSIRNYITQTQNVLNELTDSGKIINFLLTQAALHLFNPVLGKGKILNPLAVTLGPPPFAAGFTTQTLDNPLASNKIVVNPYDHIEVTTEEIDGVNIIKPDYESFFLKKGLNLLTDAFTAAGVAAPSNYFYKFDKIDKSQYAKLIGAQKNFDVFFDQEDVFTGYTNGAIEEVQAVVPFYFQDLRDTSKYLYFRAFIESFNETLSPTWNKENYYGRVDPVVTYMNTNRTVSISFKIAAMSRPGLASMWKKINNLCKMVYPTYVNGVLAGGPVIRMRVGDVIAAESGDTAVGLPGIIENLSFDYSGAPWELASFDSDIEAETGKVPQWATISIQFQVIHEINPSIDENYDFDTKNFRRMGTGAIPAEKSKSLFDSAADLANKIPKPPIGL